MVMTVLHEPLFHLICQTQVEVAKKEWELEHLQAKKEAEERKNAMEEDDMFFTYARDETYNQVPSPKSSSSKTAIDNLKMRFAKVIPNGSDRSSDSGVSYEAVENSSSKRGEDYVDVTDEGSAQNSPAAVLSSRPSQENSSGKKIESASNRRSANKLGRASRTSSRSDSRSSSRSNSKTRVIMSPDGESPAHSPRYPRSNSRQ